MIEKRRVGQFARPIKAADHNAMAEAADFYRLRQKLGLGGALRTVRQYNPGVDSIQNDSGSDVAAGDVLALHECLSAVDAGEFDDSGVEVMDWARNFIWSGKKPNTSTPDPAYHHIGNFGVVIEDIPDGEVGLCVVNGVVEAQLDVDYADHPFADIAHDTFRLTSNWYGAAQILYKVQVDSVWWAKVRIGNFQAPDYDGVVQTGGITAGSSGNVNLHYEGADTSETLTVHHDHMEGSHDAAANDECRIAFFKDVQKWRIKELEC